MPVWPCENDWEGVIEFLTPKMLGTHWLQQVWAILKLHVPLELNWFQELTKDYVKKIL